MTSQWLARRLRSNPAGGGTSPHAPTDSRARASDVKSCATAGGSADTGLVIEPIPTRAIAASRDGARIRPASCNDLPSKAIPSALCELEHLLRRTPANRQRRLTARMCDALGEHRTRRDDPTAESDHDV